ncbi:MAG: hypothetical protein BroJett013_07240 [Alphaproteobacteria bacterium]|nr:MAG: hypothetical protein BroJett013_07240 [Alphaproteobacteria bacterium]
MSDANPVTHYAQQYKGGLELLLQQKMSALRPYVTVGSYTGRGAAPIDQIGEMEARLVTVRHAPIEHQDPETDRRWVYPKDYDASVLIGGFDRVRQIADPKSTYLQAGHAAMNRAVDDVINAAFFGAARTGQEGGDSTVFPTGTQQVGVNVGGTNSGLNVEKIRAGRKILRKNFVDPSEPIYCAVTAEQMDDLLGQVQIVSSDFNRNQPLVEGDVKYFLGVNFIICERLSIGSSIRRVPMWVKNGMHLGMWADITVDITQDKTRSGLPWQIYLMMTLGATRLEEKRVVELQCYEA